MDGYVIIGTQVDTKEFDAQIDYIESQLLEIEHKLKQADMGFEVGDTVKLEAQYEKLVNQLIAMKKKKEDLNRTDFSGVQRSIDNVGNSVSKVIKRVGRWALAVFGVRSAYMFVRQSASTLAQYNEKIASDLEYIRFTLASTLQPIIEYLINLVYKLLGYVNYIAKAWFNINLFANASEDAFNKANVSANKLKRTMAGFDEMNILSDNSTGGVGLPTIDLSNSLNNQNVPKWLQWIADHKDLIANVTRDLLILFGAVTISKVLNNIARLFGTSGGTGLLGLSQLLAIIGTTYVTIIAVKGVLDAISQIRELNGVLQENIEQSEKIRQKNQDVSDTFWELQENGKLTKEQIWSYTQSLEDSIAMGTNLIDSLEEQKTWLGAITGANEKLIEQQDVEIQRLKQTITEYDRLYQQGLLNVDQQEQYKAALEKTIDALVQQGEDVSSLQRQYLNLTGKTYEIKIKADTDTASSKVDSLWEKIKKIVSGTFTFKTDFTFTGGSSGGRFAKGGIINMPGPGVPIGYNAIGGERGIEGIVPLTDSQQMSLLGEAIGKNVTINANIVNTMNGRVIGRELQTINNNSDFAFNK